jgi:hypothetical protein
LENSSEIIPPEEAALAFYIVVLKYENSGFAENAFEKLLELLSKDKHIGMPVDITISDIKIKKYGGLRAIYTFQTENFIISCSGLEIACEDALKRIIEFHQKKK